MTGSTRNRSRAPRPRMGVAVLMGLFALLACGDGGGGSGHVHGTAHELGRTEIGGIELQVTFYGEAQVGEECSVDVRLGAGAEQVRAVRAWIGDESGNGTLRRKLDGSTTLHQHFPIPEGLPENSALWLQVERTDGTRTEGSLAAPR